MSDQLLEQGLSSQRNSPEASPATATAPEMTAQTAPSITIDEMNQIRRSTSNSQRASAINQQLQDFVDLNFQVIKENADRLKDEGLISAEIWAALRQQNQMQIDAAMLTKQIADHLHTVGQNKKLSPDELFKLLDSQDTDLALVRNRSVSEMKLYEVTSEIVASLGKVSAEPSRVNISNAQESIRQYIEISGTSSEEAIRRLDRALAMQGTANTSISQFVSQYGLTPSASQPTPQSVVVPTGQSAPQPISHSSVQPVSYEVQKLAGVLTPAELAIISTALKHAKEAGTQSRIEESDRREVSRVLNQIAQDRERAAMLGVPLGNSQVVAHHLANRVFDHNGGALLAQIFVQSSAIERTTQRVLATPARPLEQGEPVTTAQPVVSRLTPEQQRAQILQQVETAATQQASSDFSRSPATVPDQRTIKITLHGILNRHPELQSDPEIQKLMLEKFQESYQKQFEQHFKSMSFFEGFYYGFQRRWSENFAQIGAFFERAIEAVRKIPENVVGFYESAKDTVINAAKSVYSFGKSIFDFVTSPDTWKKAGQWISQAWDKVTDPKTWESLYESAKKGIQSAIDWASNVENWKNLGSKIYSAASSAVTFVYDCVTDPKKAWEAVKSVGNFLYETGKSLGINDMLWGTWKFIEGAGRLVASSFQFSYSLLKNGALLLTGQQSFDECCSNLSKDFSNTYGKAINCLIESTAALKGAVLAIGEFSGITDCIKCVYYLSKGEFALAGMHAGFALLSWGSIVATVATGGAAIGAIAGVATGRMTIMQGLKSVGQVALKQVAKEGLEKLGKETGENVMKAVSKELGSELQEKVVAMTGRIVEDGVSQLASKVAVIGKEALVGKTALEQVQKMFSDIAYKHTQDLLKELKIYEHVKSATLDLLKAIHGKPLKEIEERLMKMGMSQEVAKASAGALRKALVRGVSDKEMAEILTKEITAEITKAITKEMEKPFKELFARALKGELETEAGKGLAHEMRKRGIKLTQQEIDDLVEAAWKGCKEGVERAVREVVEKAVKDAFDEFRKRKHRSNFDLQLPVARKTVTKTVENEVLETKGESIEVTHEAKPGERVFDVEKRKKVSTKKNTLLTEQTELIEEEVL